ncbi:MAG: hypothetical protein LC104_21865 [Bacteroidales bacterium]|nr:hypothetical protein [Bacteroidales bacterium]
MNDLTRRILRYCWMLCLLGGGMGNANAQAPAENLEQRSSGWTAGTGLYVVQPYFQNNPAYTIFTQQTLDTTLDARNPQTLTLSETARRVDVRHTMSAAPLVWLGYENDNGLGIRVRAWGFQQGTSQTAVLSPFAGAFNVSTANGQSVIVASGLLNTVSSATPLGLQAFGDTLSIRYGPETTAFTVTTKLALCVIDLEATQRFQSDDWGFLCSGGVRYANLDQSYNAYDAQSGSPLELRTLQSTYRFQGGGPTAAFELRRTLGSRGFSAYGLCRGSIVFGEAEQNATFFGAQLRNDDPNPQSASESRNRGIPILDLETGVEYRCPLGNTSFFGQLGFVGQQWFNAGSSSRSTLLNPATTLRPVLGGAPLDSNLALLGLAVRLGLNY